MAKFQVLLRPSTSIKNFEEDSNLIIDSQIVLSNAFKASVRIDVEVPTDTIDFGFVPSNVQQI